MFSPEAHTVTAVKSKVPTLKWTVNAVKSKVPTVDSAATVRAEPGAFSFLALRIYTEGHDCERPLTRGPSHFALFSLVSSVRSRPRLDMSSLLLGVLLLVRPLLGLCDSDGSASSPWSRTTTTTTTRPSQVPPSDHRGGHEAVQHEIPFVGCGVLYLHLDGT